MSPAEDNRWKPRRAVRLRRAVRRFVPRRFSFRLRQEGRRLVLAPGVATVDFGDLRRIYPVSRKHGWERGQPIDRYYIESFLERHRGDVRGRVLDVCDRLHSSRYGGTEVTSVDVLHLVEGNPEATIVADLADSNAFSSDMFDCVLLTQTLQFVFDVSAAVQSIHKMLRPCGVVLATVPTVSQVVHEEPDAWQDQWRFTSDATRELFGRVFGHENVDVEAQGNVLSAIAFLEGLSSTELTAAELDHMDPSYEVLVTIRAVKR